MTTNDWVTHRLRGRWSGWTECGIFTADSLARAGSAGAVVVRETDKPATCLWCVTAEE